MMRRPLLIALSLCLGLPVTVAVGVALRGSSGVSSEIPEHTSESASPLEEQMKSDLADFLRGLDAEDETERASSALGIGFLAMRAREGDRADGRPREIQGRIPVRVPQPSRSTPAMTFEVPDVVRLVPAFAEVVEPLCRILASDPSREARVNAVFALGEIAPTDGHCYDMLLRAFEDKAPIVADNAFSALAGYGRRATAFEARLTELAASDSIAVSLRACLVLRAVESSEANPAVRGLRARVAAGGVEANSELYRNVDRMDGGWVRRLIPEIFDRPRR